MAAIFRHLVRGGSFPACWRLVDVDPVPKESASSDVGDYVPISIAPVLPKVFEKIVAGKLSHFWRETACFLLQFSYQRGLGTCDALLTLSHSLQVALDRGMEERFVQIDFSAAFDRLVQIDFSAAFDRHSGLLHKLRSIDVGQFWFIASEFLGDRRQRVWEDQASVDVVSGVPQGSVLEPLLFLLCTSELSTLLEPYCWNHIAGYADDITIYAVIPRPLSRPQGNKSQN